MAIQRKETPLTNVPTCRQRANELLEGQANHSLAKHLLAWCEVSEGRVPNELFDELKKSTESSPDVPMEANLGWLLAMCHRSHEGLNRLADELEVNPGSEELQVLVGICLQKTRNHVAALNVLKHVVETSPDNDWARLHYASSLMQTGSWKEGFAELEKVKSSGSAVEKSFWGTPEKLWTGQSLKGKHIVIVGSRNRGINILLSRYITRLSEFDPELPIRSRPKIGVVCPSEQVELMRTIREISRVDSEKFEPFDYYLPIEFLPQRFGAELKSIPTEFPYLCKSRNWAHSTLTNLNSAKPLLGICWRSNDPSGGNLQYTRHLNESKSLGPKSLHFLLETLAPDYDFLSLQKDPEPEEMELLARYNVHMVDQVEFGEWTTLAQTISKLNAVLTVDSPIAHLAGAIGRECHMLLPYSADWTWGPETRTCPWYPQFKLYRQRTENAWTFTLPEAVKVLKIKNQFG